MPFSIADGSKLPPIGSDALAPVVPAKVEDAVVPEVIPLVTGATTRYWIEKEKSKRERGGSYGALMDEAKAIMASAIAAKREARASQRARWQPKLPPPASEG